jgi:ABC-2 type transport system permease protein
MGSLILDVEIPAGAIPALAMVILVAAFSCTGLGLINAALALRIRESAVLSNVFFGFLLIFTGANVPLADLPGWMRAVSDFIPFTHSIEAARRLVDGDSMSSVLSLVGVELVIGAAYAVAGYFLLRFFENQGRRHATLDRT